MLGFLDCSVRSKFVSLFILLLLFSAATQVQAEDIYPRFKQGYLSSAENSFLLTGLCEKYAWQFPVKGQVSEYAVGFLHLGNTVGFRFNADATLKSCYYYRYEQFFSYRDGRLNKTVIDNGNDGESAAAVETTYRYFADDPDRVEAWTTLPDGQQSHLATYVLDGFELTIINEKLRQTVVKTFDYRGRLSEVRSNYATVVYRYNPEGFVAVELSGKGSNYPERSKEISYHYAADGNIATMQAKELHSNYLFDYRLFITK